LEALGLAPSLAKLLSHGGEGWRHDGDLWVARGTPLFAEGLALVGAEGLALLAYVAELPELDLNASYRVNRFSQGFSEAVFAYRDSLPVAVPAYPGWRINGDYARHKATDSEVRPDASGAEHGFHWTAKHPDGARTSHRAPTLAKAIAAVEAVLALVTPPVKVTTASVPHAPE
jgi:hypothetical protein